MKLLFLSLLLTACSPHDYRPQVVIVVDAKYSNIILRDWPYNYPQPGKVPNRELTKQLHAIYGGIDTNIETRIIFMPQIGGQK
jgi:hypothetical protein